MDKKIYITKNNPFIDYTQSQYPDRWLKAGYLERSEDGKLKNVIPVKFIGVMDNTKIYVADSNPFIDRTQSQYPDRWLKAGYLERSEDGKLKNVYPVKFKEVPDNKE